MPVTSPDSIYYADTSTADSIAAISAAEANSVQAALTARLGTTRDFKWAGAAARTAQTGMTEGDIGDQADTNQRWRYSGTAWVDITNGLFPVIPTSVAVGGTGSAVVQPSGSVVLSAAATSISLNGCFTSAYRCYRVIIAWSSVASSASDVTWRLRAAGTDLSTNSSYAWSKTMTTYSTATAAVTGSTTAALGNSANIGRVQAGTSGVITMDVANPMVPTNTAYTNMFTDGGFGGISTGAAVTGSAYDGFTILHAAGGITGVINVYGYNNA